MTESEERYRDALASWDREQREWNEQKLRFEDETQALNAAIDEQRNRYERGDPEAIAEYCDLVLSRSQYPEFMPQEAKVDYDPDTATLVVEYILPTPTDIPSLQEVRYVASRGEFKETRLKDKERKALFDNVVYQIALRTIHEVYEADVIEAIDAVVFNGWVFYVDGRDGQDKKACIVSLQATKEEFGRINLSAVNPRECFRSLKGVAAPSLASLAPVAPVLQLNREDRRFIQGKAVADALDEGVNIAAMGWEEFEHLVRELFEAEFSAGGGEVKVTQSSRDWGVDAVAFDPDPIRGGKIVIQAKRYTNPVDVSSVRDLYGTVMNEGATKGILVTTSTFGPDAFRFARDKPITLLDGSNLLHLLGKHGHKARIDLREAKKLGGSLKR